MFSTFGLVQGERLEDYEAGLFSVVRAILAAMLEGLGKDQLEDLNVEGLDQVRLRPMAQVVRLPRDHGGRGDGFEWAVHAALYDGLPSVIGPIALAMSAASRELTCDRPRSVLFGYERALRRDGFVDQFLADMGDQPRLLPGGRGMSAPLADILPLFGDGPASQHLLPPRVSKAWKADMFLSAPGSNKWLAATVKSNAGALEGGPGLRVGIVPQQIGLMAGISNTPHEDPERGLWLAVLPDRDGFVGLFNDAYMATAHVLRRLGKHGEDWGPYYLKPTVIGLKLAAELERHARTPVVEIVDALGDQAQVGLILPGGRGGFQIPSWLRHARRPALRFVPRPLDFRRR